MEIAIDYTPAIADITGIGRYVRNLAAMLAQIDTHNRYKLFSAVNVSPENPSVQSLIRLQNVHLQVVPLRATWLQDMWQKWDSPAPVESLLGQAKIFHSTNFVLPPTLSMQRVVTIHDLTFLDHPEYILPAYLEFLNRFVPYSIRTSNAIITVSD